MLARPSAVDARRAALVQLRSVIVTAPEQLREELRRLPVTQLIRRCGRFRGSASRTPDELAIVLALRSLARSRPRPSSRPARARDRQARTRACPRTAARTGRRPDRRRTTDRSLANTRACRGRRHLENESSTATSTRCRQECGQLIDRLSRQPSKRGHPRASLQACRASDCPGYLCLSHRAANVGQIRRFELFAADGSIGVTQDASGGDESDRTGDVLSAEAAAIDPAADSLEVHAFLARKRVAVKRSLSLCDLFRA